MERIIPIAVAMAFVTLGCAGESPIESEDTQKAEPSALLASCNAASVRAATPASRLPVLDRALAWVAAGVPYSQSNYYQGYRQDCSGFVSMSWSLGQSRVTSEFAPFETDITHQISYDDLVAGDALNRNVEDLSEGHIMLFGGWMDEAHTEVCVVQENQTGTPANVKAYGEGWWGEFVPIRYDALGDGGDAPAGSTPPAPEPPPFIAFTNGEGQGYWEVKPDGSIYSFATDYFGGANGWNHPEVVALASTPSKKGYWMSTSDGAIYSFGDAKYEGGSNTLQHQPILAMASANEGYWQLANDGAIYSFGDAQYHGGANQYPHAPVVGIAATASGNGYWIASTDGAIYSFGDAQYQGGANGPSTPHQPIVGIARAGGGQGYWLVANDGAVYSFGSAQYHGGASSTPHAPIIGILSTPSGAGYWLMANDGAVYSFGDAPYEGGGNTK